MIRKIRIKLTLPVYWVSVIFGWPIPLIWCCLTVFMSHLFSNYVVGCVIWICLIVGISNSLYEHVPVGQEKLIRPVHLFSIEHLFSILVFKGYVCSFTVLCSMYCLCNHNLWGLLRGLGRIDASGSLLGWSGIHGTGLRCHNSHLKTIVIGFNYIWKCMCVACMISFCSPWFLEYNNRRGT